MSFESNFNFDEYTNFSNKKEPPALPLEKQPNFNEKVELSAGSYTAVFDLDETRVVKLTRMLDVRMGQIKPQGEKDKYLVSIATDEEYKQTKEAQDREKVTNKMIEFAQERRRTHKMLDQYIGEFLPVVEMYAVVESPRRELEKRINRELPKEFFEQVPVAEVAVMEIVEKVNAKRSLQRLNYKALELFYDSEEYTEQRKRFAEGALQLLLEKGIIVDVCDFGGVRARNMEGKEIYIKTVDDFVKADQEQSIPYPRNVTTDKGKLKFFDTFPVGRVNQVLVLDIFNQIKEPLENANYDKLRELHQNTQNPQEFERVMQYCYLLKKLGAEFQ